MESQFVNIHTHRPNQDGISPTADGIHPWDAEIASASDIKSTVGIQAIGEIGLDFATKIDRQQQRELFRAQLSEAERRKLPVILHCVRAFEDTMMILDGYTLSAVIFHGFIGSTEQAQRAIEKGYYLSFGERTFTSPKTMKVLRTVPLGSLFFETDDSPTRIEEIYRMAAEVRGIGIEELKRQTTDNYERIFTESNG